MWMGSFNWMLILRVPDSLPAVHSNNRNTQPPVTVQLKTRARVSLVPKGYSLVLDAHNSHLSRDLESSWIRLRCSLPEAIPSRLAGPVVGLKWSLTHMLLTRPFSVDMSMWSPETLNWSSTTPTCCSIVGMRQRRNLLRTSSPGPSRYCSGPNYYDGNGCELVLFWLWLQMFMGKWCKLEYSRGV